MSEFDKPFWNLCQAAVWVEFRERDMVEKFAVADHEAYKALHFYPEMPFEGKIRVRIGESQDLERALLDGRLASSGFRQENQDTRTSIPKSAWVDVYLDPPHALDRRPERRGRETWRHILIKSADIRRLWPTPDEGKARELYDWGKIESWYREIVAEKPEMSQNNIIREIAVRHEKQFGSKGPSRSAIQQHMKSWK